MNGWKNKSIGRTHSHTHTHEPQLKKQEVEANIFDRLNGIDVNGNRNGNPVKSNIYKIDSTDSTATTTAANIQQCLDESLARIQYNTQYNTA